MFSAPAWETGGKLRGVFWPSWPVGGDWSLCVVMASDGSALSGPRNAAVMEAILKEMGVEEYEPTVIHQMLEFSYREQAMFHCRPFSFFSSIHSP